MKSGLVRWTEYRNAKNVPCGDRDEQFSKTLSCWITIINNAYNFILVYPHNLIFGKLKHV